MFKNKGGDDAEGFCYGRNFQIGLNHSNHPAKNGTNFFEHAFRLQEQLAVGLTQPRK